MDNKELEYVDFVVTARKYKTTLTEKFKKRQPWQPAQPGEVKSLLPGTVKQILVKEGDLVEKGQLLMIHEAMKMLNRITAPETGKVTGIYVNDGDKIGKNHLMIKIEIK
jgi:Acetyl/propionyl-CoA carboxylase, alpha subunit